MASSHSLWLPIRPGGGAEDRLPTTVFYEAMLVLGSFREFFFLELIIIHQHHQ